MVIWIAVGITWAAMAVWGIWSHKMIVSWRKASELNRDCIVRLNQGQEKLLNATIKDITELGKMLAEIKERLDIIEKEPNNAPPADEGEILEKLKNAGLLDDVVPDPFNNI